MTFKTILVHVNDERRASAQLAAAVELARNHDAHIVGLNVIPLVAAYVEYPDASLDTMLEALRERYKQRASALQAKFDEATAVLRAKAEWRTVQADTPDIGDAVIRTARCADLIVASQEDASWPESITFDVPDRIGIESGRPLLLLPNSQACNTQPKRITLAWNGRREAARATFDALPFLKSAEEVNVLCIDPEKEPYLGDFPGIEVSGALARHGVKCVASQSSSRGLDTGEEILRQAKAFGSELLIMGFYGHSRTREFLLGGASRHVLRHAPLPVFLSH